MKRAFIGSLILVFILGFSPAIGFDAAAQEGKSDAQALKILGQMIEAMGGRKFLESVKDTTATGTLEMVAMGLQGAATMTMKTPNMFRMDMEIMGMSITQAFDGEVGWFTNPQTGAVEEITGAQLESVKREALGDQVYLYPEKYGIVYTFKGQEKLEDQNYDVLLVTYQDGHEVTMYLDAETHLVYKTISLQPNEMTGMEAEVEAYTTDYRKVGEGMAAFTITQYMDGEEFMIITLDEVKFNTGVEDDFFKM